MKHNSNFDIDRLIKNIYQSYIDIKSKEFDEIQKDMLLDNIKLLYSLVKTTNLSDTPVNRRLSELSADTIEKNTEVTIDKVLEPITIPEMNEEAIPISTEKIMVDSSHSEIVIPKQEIISPAQEPIQSTPKVSEEPAKEDEELKSEVLKEVNPIEEVSENTEISEPIQLSEKLPLNSSQIADYVKIDEGPKRDIYDLLDINTRIGLVEIFFKGNSIELTECLVLINKSNDQSECQKILNMYANKYGIKDSDDIYHSFSHLIDRKFHYIK